VDFREICGRIGTAFSALALLVGRQDQEELPVCEKLTEGAGVEQCANDLHMVQLLPIMSGFTKIEIGLVPVYPCHRRAD